MSEIKAGTILNYIRLFISLGIGFFLSPFILENLGKAEYGIYTIAGTIIGWLALCDFGLTASTTKFLSEYQAKGDKEGEAHYLGNVAALFSVIGGVVLVAGLCIYPFLSHIFPKFNEEELELYRILYLMTLFNTAVMFPARSLGGISASRQKYKIPGIVGTAMSLASTTGTIIVLLMGYKSIALCSVSIAFGILGMLWNVYYCFGILKARMSWNGWDIPLCKSMYAFSFWMFLDQLVSIFTWGCGNMVVGSFLGAAEISAYSYGLSLMNYYFMFSGCLAGLYLPRVVSIIVNKKSIDELEKEWINVGRFQLASLGLLLTGIIFMGDVFLKLWVGRTLGEEIYTSYFVAVCIIIPMTPTLVQALNWQILQATNKIRYRTVGMLVISASCLALGCILIQLHGAVAFACSTGLAFLLGQGVYTNYIMRKHVGTRISNFIKGLLKNSHLAILIIISLGFLIRMTETYINSWSMLLCCASLYSLVYILVVCNLYLTKSEQSLIPSSIKKYIIIKKNA